MERKKSILFLLLILLCFVVVGCGKGKTEDTKKEEKTSSVQTLKCSNEDGDTKVSMTIEQNKKTYEITKAQMTMSAKSDLYEDMGLTDEQLKSAICNEDLGAYKSCNVKNSDGIITVDYEFHTFNFSCNFYFFFCQVSVPCIDFHQRISFSTNFCNSPYIKRPLISRMSQNSDIILSQRSYNHISV